MSDLEERVAALEARYNCPPPLSNKVFFRYVMLPIWGFMALVAVIYIMFT